MDVFMTLFHAWIDLSPGALLVTGTLFTVCTWVCLLRVRLGIQRQNGTTVWYAEWRVIMLCTAVAVSIVFAGASFVLAVYTFFW